MVNAKSNTKLQIAIIGANGNVGREIVSLLGMDNSISIHAFVRDCENAVNLFGIAVHTHYFDYDELNDSAFKAIDKLFLIQPNYDPINRSWFQIAKNNGVSHIVFLSSIEPEAFQLRESEIATEQSGIEYTILRPNTFMQNFNIYDTKDILNKHAIYYPAGEGKISFIDIRDVALAVIQVLLSSDQHLNKTYTLTGQQALGYKEACEILSLECGHAITYIDTLAFPELENDDMKNDPIWNNYFLGVRNNRYSLVTPDLSELTKQMPRTLNHYAKDYWHK